MKVIISASLFALVLLLASSVAFAQSVNSEFSEQSYIEVIGTSEKEVIPNEIYIGIVISERYENKVKLTIESQEE
jgi:hypothetical protein